MENHHEDHDHDQDNNDHDQTHNVNKTGSSGGPPATPRWNPTKEQINMLEGLYRQGIRTPSAEQIQQITTRLRAFGHIEGKNVFYWFQNHKARQRQKQKQESMAYINRFLHRSNPNSQPVFSPNIPVPNVVCGPYYVPVQSPSEPIGAHHQNNKLPLSISTRTASRRSPKLDNKFSQRTRVFQDECNSNKMMMNSFQSHQETLPLFPLSPTGVLQGKHDYDHNQDHHSDHIGQTSNSASYEVDEQVGGSSSSGYGGDQTFYDFFSR